MAEDTTGQSMEDMSVEPQPEPYTAEPPPVSQGDAEVPRAGTADHVVGGAPVHTYNPSQTPWAVSYTHLRAHET